MKKGDNKFPINWGDFKTKTLIAGSSAFIGIVAFWVKAKIRERSMKVRKEMGMKMYQERMALRDKDSNTDGTTIVEQDQYSYEPQDETLNEVIERDKQAANPEHLFGDMLSSGDICVIFSPTGEGKSILAMQIAIGIATGEGAKSFNGKDAEKAQQNVIIYDAEQGDHDINSRYGMATFPYPECLVRSKEHTFESSKRLLYDIGKRVGTFTSDATVIIDNLTAICPSLQGDSVRDFYNSLKEYKDKAMLKGVRVTFIIVSHTVKEYAYPINITAMSGSVNIANFATVVYAISPTRFGSDTKMLVELKHRGKAKNDMGIVMRIVDTPYLHFAYDREEEQTAAMPQKGKANSATKNKYSQAASDKRAESEKKKQVILQSHENGKKNKDIAADVGVSATYVGKVIKANKQSEN